MRSIRHFLTLLLLSSLTLVIFSAAIQGYRSSMAMSSHMFDAQLQMLHNNLAVAYGNLTNVTLERHPELAIQVWQDDRLLIGTDSVPKAPITNFTEGFSDRNFSGQRWRVLAGKLEDDQKWLFVAQPLSVRFELAESMILAAMTPLILSLPLIALIVYFSVTRGLRPLKALSQDLSSRKGNDLSVVELDDTPSELTSVVTTLNSVFARLASAFEREQQFASNAAHELRTPLSVLKINLHNLAQEYPAQKARIASLQQDTDRMIHVVNQILLLSRTNPEFFRSQRTTVDFCAICQQVIADLYTKVEAKSQSIELEAEECPLFSTEFTLYTLVQNLVSNAIKYAPEFAQIQVKLQQNPDAVELVVEDSGKGVDEMEFNHLLKRFYRSQTQQQASEGSGLGLAIVQQIVTLHQGDIQLSRSVLGGLCVSITLPRSYTGEANAAI